MFLNWKKSHVYNRLIHYIGANESIKYYSYEEAITHNYFHFPSDLWKY